MKRCLTYRPARGLHMREAPAAGIFYPATQTGLLGLRAKMMANIKRNDGSGSANAEPVVFPGQSNLLDERILAGEADKARHFLALPKREKMPLAEAKKDAPHLIRFVCVVFTKLIAKFLTPGNELNKYIQI